MDGIFWWVIFPYITLTIMIFGSIYRFSFRQLTWVAPSTEFFEKKWLRLGSPLMHYGLLFAFVGHLMGMVVPMGVYHKLGITDQMYHFLAIYGGSFVGLMLVVGAIILLIRKIMVDRVRTHASFADYFAIVSLIIVAGLGVYISLVYNLAVVAYEYRATIGPWFRSLFIFRPQYGLMLDVPFLFQLHVISGFAFFAAIPFTSLVHLFSAPVHYLFRAPQQYRSRTEYKKKDFN